MVVGGQAPVLAVLLRQASEGLAVRLRPVSGGAPVPAVHPPPVSAVRPLPVWEVRPRRVWVVPHRPVSVVRLHPAWEEPLAAEPRNSVPAVQRVQALRAGVLLGLVRAADRLAAAEEEEVVGNKTEVRKWRTWVTA